MKCPDLTESRASVVCSLGCDSYRIVQEGLTNVGKHAAGTPVLVCVGNVRFCRDWWRPVNLCLIRRVPAALPGL